MKRERLWLVGLYVLAHAPLLFTTGLFLDDFGLFGAHRSVNNELLWATGRPLYGYFVSLIFLPGSALLPRAFTFFAYLISGFLLQGVLRTIEGIEPQERFIITAFFLVFPGDSTRVMLILSYYAFSYLLFFLGFWLLARYMVSGRLLARLGALCLFLGSFGLMSLLCFFGLVILYIGYKERSILTHWRGATALVVRYADFLALPLVYWALRSLLFPPYGPYAGYFQMDLAHVAPLAWASAIRGAVLYPVFYSALGMGSFGVPVIVAATALLCMCWRGLSVSTDARRSLMLFAVGCVALFFALLPYLAIRKMPGYWDWLSRHALLVPLGVSFTLSYGIALIVAVTRVPRFVGMVTYCLFICLFVAGNVQHYAAYWLDWDKSLALVQRFGQNPVVRRHTSFLIKDDAEDWNAKRKYLRFYEYAGLAKMAFHDERRFMQLERLWKGPDDLKEIAFLLAGGRLDAKIPGYGSVYCMNDWIPTLPEHRIIIHPIRGKPGFLEIVKLKYQELVDPSAFIASLDGLLTLDTERLSGP